MGLIVAIHLLALVALIVLGVGFKLIGFGLLGVLALPVLDMLAGLVLLFTRHRKLGVILFLSGLVVTLIGLGTCALILSNTIFVAIHLLTFAVLGVGFGQVWLGLLKVLALPALDIMVGLVLLFTRHRKLGVVMLLSGLVVMLIGLGTCGLILSHISFNGH